MITFLEIVNYCKLLEIIVIISYLLYHSLCWCLFVRQPGAYHAPRASDTQVIHSDYTLSTFLRIRADPSMLIFWVSVTLALSDTLLMFSTIPFFIVPSAPTTTGITSVFICHILCISNSRSLYLLFFSISFRAIFLSDGIDLLLLLLLLLLFNCSQQSTINTQHKYIYLAVFVLQETSLTGFFTNVTLTISLT